MGRLFWIHKKGSDNVGLRKKLRSKRNFLIFFSFLGTRSIFLGPTCVFGGIFTWNLAKNTGAPKNPTPEIFIPEQKL